MKVRQLLALSGFLALAATASAQAIPWLFEPEAAAPPDKILWRTEPGVRYDLWKSDNLADWTHVPGYPAAAPGLAMEHAFTPAAKGFFKIVPIDEQPPVVVAQYPAVDGFAVGRFADISVELSDATSIDPASIRLTVGALGTFTTASPQVAFAGGALTFDSGGDTALGTYGATIPVTLAVADTLGNAASYTFSFTLEVQPKVAPNLFVFGAPAAQRAGQRIPATPTAALARPTGPVPMNGEDPWEIESVLPDRVVIAYTGGAPAFAVGTYLANLTPVNISDIFYRKVLAVNDDPVNQRLTLMTADVPLAEIAEEGTCAMSAGSAVFNLGEDGAIQPAAEIIFSKTFPRIGIDLDDTGPLPLPGNPKFGISLHEANAWLTPSLDLAIETKGWSVQRAALQARADIEGTLIPEFSFRPAGAEKGKEWNLHRPLWKLVLIGSIGPVPVWLDFTYTTKLKLEAEANVEAALRFGWSRNASLSAGASYVKDASPRVTWTRNATVAPLVVEPVTLTLGGTVQAKASLVPQLDVRVESLLGFYVNADPRAEFEIKADGGLYISGRDGGIQMAPGGTATFTCGLFADLNAGLSVVGVDQQYLPAMDPLRIWTLGWELEYPEPAALAFTSPAAPQSVTVASGGSLNLEGQATGGKGPIFYQWLHNGFIIPGQTAPQLVISGVTSGNAGSYTLRARSGTGTEMETVISPPFTVTVSPPGTTPDGFALIPAGSFQMGDQSSPPVGFELPVHSVYVSAFYMAKYEVTKELWDSVRAWGAANGYTDLPVGNDSYASKGANHPVHSISWYDMVKWCNARSQKEGLTPCYTVSGSIYKTAPDSTSVVCNWSANGYRLPTEAEWEKSARGGRTGYCYPWGDTIGTTQANYSFSGNPWATGDQPYTSVVGSYPANGYGLYDMAGNMWEWCWDRYSSSYYASSPGSDPSGPSSGSSRVCRGGAWGNEANTCRAAYRNGNFSPTGSNGFIGHGFRVARSSVQ